MSAHSHIKALFFACSILLASCVNAQNETTNWFFGTNTGVTFTASAVTTTPNSQVSSSLCTASISDANGALLFYTDGTTIWTRTHSVMANGSGLAGTGAFQPAVIVPQPQSNQIFFVFTVGGIGTSNGLSYSVVDMSLASGNGSVTVKNVPIHSGCRDRVTATKHCNGQDYWIVSTNYSSSFIFVSCCLTSTGVTAAFTTPTTTMSPILGTGQLKISPNSHKLAINGSTVASSFPYFPYIDTRVFDFDPSNGTVASSALVFSYGIMSFIGSYLTRTFGCEFSPSSRYFYVTFYSSISKWDLCNPTSTVTSGYIFPPESTQEDSVNKRAMQLAPDGKIYIAMPNKNKLGIISNPNNTNGIATFTDVFLGTYTCATGISQHPGYYFEQRPNVGFSYSALPNSCNTISFQPVDVCPASGYSVSGFNWNFGDALSATGNTSNVQSPTHTFSVSGQYTVSLVRYYSGCTFSADTLRQIIAITVPTLNIFSQSIPCAQNSVSVSVTGGSGNYFYTWSPSSKTTAVATFTNAGNYTISVLDQSANCLITQTIAVSVIQHSASVTSSSLQCFGQPNASATVNVSGSPGPFTYSWSGSSQTGSVASGLAGGSQSVVVTDVLNQCTVQTTFYVPQPTQLTITPSPSAYSACQGKTITMHAYPNGGVGAYTYSWSSGSSTTSETSSLPAGSYVYTVQVKDGNNCVATCTLPVTFFAYPQLTFTNAAVCPGDSAHVYISGAPAYTWQPGQTYANHVDLLPIASQVYTITGDNMGCTSSGTAGVTVFPPPTLTVSPSQTLCSGSTLITSSTPGTLNQWHGPASLSTAKPSFTIYNVQPANAGTYTLNFADMNGCKDSAMISLAVMLSPTPAINGKTVICTGQSSTLQATGGVIYQWNNGSTSSIINANGLQSTGYTVTVTDGYGCSATTSISVIVEKCTGISGSSNSAQWKIYPNPSDGRIYVDGPPNTPVTLHIMDADGKLIRQINYQVSDPLNAVELNLPAGVYVVEIDLAGVTQMRERIVIGK